MKIEEAIKRLRAKTCCEKPIQHYCNDSCMYNGNNCEIQIAFEALEKQIPKKVKFEKPNRYVFQYRCPVCENKLFAVCGEYRKPHEIQKYCEDCGQALDWNE